MQNNFKKALQYISHKANYFSDLFMSLSVIVSALMNLRVHIMSRKALAAVFPMFFALVSCVSLNYGLSKAYLP